MLFVKAQQLVALLDKHLDEQGMPHNKTVRRGYSHQHSNNTMTVLTTNDKSMLFCHKL